MPPLALCALVLTLTLGSACAPGVTAEQLVVQTAATAANATRLGIETAEATALALYRAEQSAEVTRIHDGGGTKEQAVSAVTAVRTKWAPVWAALDTAQAAHAALVAALAAYDAGKQADVPGTLKALSEAEHDAAAAIALARGNR